jgi:aspartate/methionine/tyrosine aminotransferase
MAGWRVGVICAAKERIDEILRFKSNMDSGMFLPLQLAAAKALTLEKDWFDEVNKVYKSRRKKAYELLDLLGCEYSKEQAGMFLWANIPAKYKDAYAVCDDVLYKARVFITPGGIFGSAGEKYLRVSLCSPEEKFDASIERIKKALK